MNAGIIRGIVSNFFFGRKSCQNSGNRRHQCNLKAIWQRVGKPVAPRDLRFQSHVIISVMLTTGNIMDK